MLLDDNVKQQDSPLKTDGYDILEVQDSDSDEAAMSTSAMILHTNQYPEAWRMHAHAVCFSA